MATEKSREVTFDVIEHTSGRSGFKALAAQFEAQFGFTVSTRNCQNDEERKERFRCALRKEMKSSANVDSVSSL